MFNPAGLMAAPIPVVVKAQPLSNALVTLAVEANISISTPKGMEAIQAPALKGRMSVENALERLLEDSGYTYRRIDAATYEIIRQVDARPAIDRPDIVVTASLQPQALKNAPGSISVLTAGALETGGLNDAADVAASAAGMVVTNLGPGRNKIILRGLSDGVFSGQTQSTIGVYLGDVRLTYGAPDPDLRLTDMAAVEILRGPQGVRYGAGAETGVYRMAPNAPDPSRYSADMQATALSVDGGGNGSSLDLAVNAPFMDGRGAVRGVLYRDEAPGWLDNPGLGLTDSNRTRRQGGRAAAMFDLGGSWTISAQGVLQTIDSADSQYVTAGSVNQNRTARVREPHDNDFSLASVTIKGALPFAELTSTSAVGSHEIDSLFDASGVLAPFGVASGETASLMINERYRFYSQELRLRGAAGRFPWALGGFASYGEVDAADRAGALAAPAAAYDHARKDEIRELAVFGEVTYALTEKITVTLGARAFTTELETRTATARSLLGTSDVFAGHKRESDFAPKLDVNYRSASGASYYFVASEGYRTGGFNSGGLSSALFAGSAQPFRSYDADELWNIEIGAKHTFLRDRLSVHTALFDETWRNVQSDQLLADGLPFAGNVGDAHVFGFEAESSWKITDTLRAETALSLSEAEIQKVKSSFPAPPEAALPGAPHIILGASLSYARPLKDDWSMEARLSSRYIGPSSITFADEQRTDIDGLVDMSVRLGLVHGDWLVMGFADNVFNGSGETFSYGNPLLFGRTRITTPQTPRTIGLSIRKTFSGEKSY